MKRSLKQRALPRQDSSHHTGPQPVQAANDERWFFDTVAIDEEDRPDPLAGSGILLGAAFGLVFWLLLFNLASHI